MQEFIPYAEEVTTVAEIPLAIVVERVVPLALDEWRRGFRQYMKEQMQQAILENEEFFGTFHIDLECKYRYIQEVRTVELVVLKKELGLRGYQLVSYTVSRYRKHGSGYRYGFRCTVKKENKPCSIS